MNQSKATGFLAERNTRMKSPRYIVFYLHSARRYLRYGITQKSARRETLKSVAVSLLGLDDDLSLNIVNGAERGCLALSL
jgi:hypothetical protein